MTFDSQVGIITGSLEAENYSCEVGTSNKPLFNPRQPLQFRRNFITDPSRISQCLIWKSTAFKLVEAGGAESNGIYTSDVGARYSFFL